MEYSITVLRNHLEKLDDAYSKFISNNGNKESSVAINNRCMVKDLDASLKLLIKQQTSENAALNISDVSGRLPLKENIEKSVKEYMIKVGSVEGTKFIEHDFREGIKYVLDFISNDR